MIRKCLLGLKARAERQSVMDRAIGQSLASAGQGASDEMDRRPYVGSSDMEAPPQLR